MISTLSLDILNPYILEPNREMKAAMDPNSIRQASSDGEDNHAVSSMNLIRNENDGQAMKTNKHPMAYGINVTVEEDNQVARADALSMAGGNNEIWITETSTATSSSGTSDAENSDDTQSENSSEFYLTIIPAPSKLAYDTGHGDFCFGRWCERNSPWSLRKRDDQNLYEGSNGVAVAELNGFDRKGVFPFPKLPAELRRGIFRFLLFPFYGHSGHNLTIVHISYHYNSPATSKTFEEYLDGPDNEFCWENSDGETVREKWSAEEYESKKADFYCQQADRAHLSKHHPSRTGNYTISTIASSESSRSYGCDWVFLNWIRKLAVVNKQFRQEIGDLFWARTHLTADSHNLKNLLHLINDRPAIHEGIKSLALDFDFERSEPLIHMPEFLANWPRHLRLEKLSIELWL